MNSAFVVAAMKRRKTTSISQSANDNGKTKVDTSTTGLDVKNTRTRRSAMNASNSKPIGVGANSSDSGEEHWCLCSRVSRNGKFYFLKSRFQISFGEMIGCDNDACQIEWFHFECVQLTSKPKGKWYCPQCRGDRPNVLKPSPPTGASKHRSS
jgi:inhibitor-of-growth protein 1